MTARRVVLTGYEPWSYTSENPALRVPMESDKMTSLVDEALEEYRPDVWISLRLYPGLATIGVEGTAANGKDFPIADTANAQPNG